jgi:hypothetical protein
MSDGDSRRAHRAVSLMPKHKDFKKTHGGFPAVVYVKREENGSLRYFVCGEHAEDLPFEVGETAEVARYTFADHVKAKVKVVLGDDE